MTITATDQYDNTISNFSHPIKLSDSTNTISPTETTAFSGGVWSGSVNITQTIESEKITATYGAVQAESNTFEWKAGEQSIPVYSCQETIRKACISSADNPLIVKAVDTYGNPLSKVSIGFSVVSYPIDAIDYSFSPESRNGC